MREGSAFDGTPAWLVEVEAEGPGSLQRGRGQYARTEAKGKRRIIDLLRESPHPGSEHGLAEQECDECQTQAWLGACRQGTQQNVGWPGRGAASSAAAEIVQARQAKLNR